MTWRKLNGPCARVTCAWKSSAPPESPSPGPPNGRHTLVRRSRCIPRLYARSSARVSPPRHRYVIVSSARTARARCATSIADHVRLRGGGGGPPAQGRRGGHRLEQRRDEPVRIVVQVLRLEPEAHRLARGRRDVERAPDPVPDGEPRAVVALVVLGARAVVDLVLRGADEEVLEPAAVAQPDVRVPEVRADGVEDEAGGVHAEQLVLHGALAEE